MSGHYHEHSQNKYAYEPYSSTESLSLQLKKVCLFFLGSQAVQPRTPANRQTGRPERFTLIDADSELITSVQEELVV